jgi:hypothetical protein
VGSGKAHTDETNVWDASHTYLVALWQSAGALFPTSFVRSFRVLEPSLDVVEAAAAYGQIPTVFFSVVLSCGHVVHVPQEIAGRSGDLSRCRAIVPCYRCWMNAGGSVAGFACSFCGMAHPFDVSCVRPSP